jgi:predicted Zn finger-like uncharacterized protein
MNVSCPDCRSIFRVDPAKVPPSGVRARCSVCGGVISIPAPTGQNTPASGTPAVGSSTGRSESQPRPRATPASADAWDPPPFSNPTQRTPAARPASAQPASPPARTEVPASSRPKPESAERSSIAATATPPSPTSGLPEFTPPPAVPPFTPPASSPFAPSARPASSPFTPSAPPPSSPSSPNASPFVPGGARPATPPRTQAPPPSPATGDGGARRPLNPFLSKDPNQRAKRLARALVSDIITYHPAKHAEGLRDGTLKQLFREEIKKSFEEYIAQVGQQLAESTTYFQEALNEVLGAGKKIF